MRSGAVVFGMVALLAGQAVATLTNCYQPNGTLFSSDVPCNPGASNSMCCAKGWTCLSDGVCQVNIDNNDYFYRGTCTDKSWNANECLSRCLNFNSNSSWALGKCRIAGQDSYCCSGDPDCDCGTGQGVFNLGTAAASTLTVIGASTFTATGSAAPQTTLSTTNTGITTGTSSVTSRDPGATSLSVPATAKPTASAAASSGTDSVALGAGLGVGLGLGLIALALAIWWLVKRRKNKRAAQNADLLPQQQQHQYQQQTPYTPQAAEQEKKLHPGDGAYYGGSPNTPFVEADAAQSQIVEAPGNSTYQHHTQAQEHAQQQVPLVEAPGDTSYRQT